MTRELSREPRGYLRIWLWIRERLDGRRQDLTRRDVLAIFPGCNRQLVVVRDVQPAGRVSEKPGNWPFPATTTAAQPGPRAHARADWAGRNRWKAVRGRPADGRRERVIARCAVAPFKAICACRQQGLCVPCGRTLDIAACSCQGSPCEGSDDSQPLYGRLGWVERIANPSLLVIQGAFGTFEQSERVWRATSSFNTGQP